jgi:selenocysteine lyase/cysteine desulfurase
MVATALLEMQYTMREYGAPWERWMTEVDTARRLFADHIGASADEVAVVPSASAAAYQVASTRDWTTRSRIVTTDMEFPSVAHVWLAQQPRGAEVVYAPDRDGVVEAETYEELINETCGLVSVPMISYRNGARLPVRSVIDKAHEAGAPVFVDCYQGAGVEPIDVHELGCDYLTSGALKYLLGLPGIAFLYVRDGLRDQVAPSATGWFGRVNPFSFDPRTIDVPDHARRFESGTPSIPSAFGAAAGLRLLQSVAATTIRDHVSKLAQQLHDRLVEGGERPWSPHDPAARGPQVAIFDDSPDELGRYLASRRIVTSPRGDLLRLSLHYYNTVEDLDAVISAIRAYRNL